MPMEWLPLAQAALMLKLTPFRWKAVLRFMFTVEFIDWKTFFHNPGGLNDRLCRRVVAEDAAHLVAREISIVNPSHAECLQARHVSIFGLLGESTTEVTVEQSFQHGNLHQPSQSGLISITQPVAIQHDAGATQAEGFCYLIQVRSNARPNAHAGYDDSSIHCLPSCLSILVLCFFQFSTLTLSIWHA